MLTVMTECAGRGLSGAEKYVAVHISQVVILEKHAGPAAVGYVAAFVV